MSGHDNRSGSESEDDDFNPQPEVDEDDVAPSAKARPKPVVEDEDDGNDHEKVQGDEEEEDEEQAGDDVENDEDDEEDEEEDEEDEDIQRPRKRTKRTVRNQFIEEEAEVDDEDEEEEEADDEIAEEIHPDDLLEPTGADLDDRHHRELDLKRQAHAQKDAEAIAKELDEKYRRREQQLARRAATGAIPLALPTVNDPSIWGFKCRPGKEKEIIMGITRRMDDAARAGRPVKVYSAFERGSGPMSGFLYVEADAKQDVIALLESIPNVFMGSAPLSIEVKERPDLLRKRKRTPLEVDKFVRVLRPALYKGDLAKIVEVNGNGLDCTVQLVPRLDYGLNEDANAADSGKRKRGFFGKGADRPPQKLFNEADAKKKHMKYLSMAGSGAQRAYTYKGDDYQNGFLIKDVKINYIQTENVNPKMDEMQFFAVTTEDGTETLDLVAVQAAQKATQTGSTFVSGDSVEIYDGEQKGVRGTTISVTGEIVSIRVTEGTLKGQRIEAPVKTLRKLFRDGDHVKVIGGSKYIDEVGMVTRIKDDRITLLTDSTQTEITVFSKDLKRAADSATLGQELHSYRVNDLVYLDASTMGAVTKVDREVLRVLDQNGNTRTVLHTQVSNFPANYRNVTTDRDGSELRVNDQVKETGGEMRTGNVMYIHHSAIFVRSGNHVNEGLFVTRGTNVTTMAAKNGRAQATGPDLGKLNPALQQAGPGGKSMPPPRFMGRDKMIGKTVSIRKGGFKGYIGIVKDTVGDEARIELHTKNRVVSVKKEFLAVKDPVTGNNIDFGSRLPNRSRGGGYTGSTPSYSGSRTPGWGKSSGSGPSWGASPSGGRTPGWGGGRTPGWGGDGGRTAYGGDGSRTAYGGDGSRTAYGGATAYGGTDGSRTAYGGFNSGGRTPGGPSWGGAPSKSSSNNLSAPTPGAYNAPTPSGYNALTPGGFGAYTAPTPGGPPMDAPTPGNFNAPTPGESAGPTPRGYGGYGSGYGATPAASAPTPAAWTDTPWGGAPETPAPSGIDEDPRYE